MITDLERQSSLGDSHREPGDDKDGVAYRYNNEGRFFDWEGYLLQVTGTINSYPEDHGGEAKTCAWYGRVAVFLRSVSHAFAHPSFAVSSVDLAL
jgi:hypothetical protein